MREIKFRAWDKEGKRMLSISEIDFHQKHIWGVWRESDIRQGNYKLLFDECILMQFTGLKDKNGKEIYEGDIVKYKHITGFNAEEDYEQGADDMGSESEYIKAIEFKNGEFYPRPAGYFPDDGYYAWRNWDFEVIGNVYENPELLK